MKRHLLYFILLTTVAAFSQPTISWQKAIGGSLYDNNSYVIQTNDGGFIVLGTTYSNNGDVHNNHGGLDMVVYKLSVTGVIEWQKCYGGTLDDFGNRIKKTIDGGYVLVGSSSSNDGDISNNNGLSDYCVIKITSSGVVEWQKSFGGPNYDNCVDIQQTADGGYILVGNSSENGGDVAGIHNNSSDYWVVKLNTIGIMIWQKALGSNGYDTPGQVIQTADGGYLINGYTQQGDGDVTGFHGFIDAWLVKLDAIGIIEWQKALGGTNWDNGVGIIQNSEGDYIVAGASDSSNGDVTNARGGRDGWVLKLNPSGNILWQKTFGGSDEDVLISLQQTADGGYIFGGSSRSNDQQVSGLHSNNGNHDCWIVKTDSSGNFEWGKLFGGSGNDAGGTVIQCTDGSYLYSGSTGSTNGDVSGNHGEYDGWLVKFTNPLEVKPNELGMVNLYPNPAKNVLHIQTNINISNASYKIFDQLSRVVSEGILNDTDATVSIDPYTNGIYYLKIEDFAAVKFIKN